MDGDVGFLKHVASRVEVEILDASECASTSSGICSDIDSRSIGLLPAWPRKKSFYKRLAAATLFRLFRDGDSDQFGPSFRADRLGIGSHTIDVRTSTFYSKQLDKMMPILISANSQLHLFIGPNRCLLISNGQLLASANSASDDRPMWKQMRISDVQCALDQLNLLPLTNGETHLSQCWLRSSSGLIPYYVNLFRVQLTNHLQLVCLAEAKHDHLIRTVILLYDQLQQLAKQVNSESMQQHSLNETKLTLADVEKMLLDLNLPQDEASSDRAFLRNTKKTTAFLNSLWNRLLAEISKNNEENGISMTPSSNRRFSLITIKRAISNVSLVWNNKATSQPNITVQKNLSLQLEVLITYFRRQLLSIIQELCCVSNHEAQNYKLKLFQDAIPRIIRTQHEKTIESCRFGDQSNNYKIINYLRPVDLSLDMMSYSVTVKHLHMSITYSDDETQNEFDDFSRSSDNPMKIIDVSCSKSGKKYTIFQISEQFNSSEKSSVQNVVSNWLNGSNSNSNKSNDFEGISATAIFPVFIHKELAAKQIKILYKQKKKLADHSASDGVDVDDVDLDGSVVLRSDQAARRRAAK
ncbi:hypothetical protein WR25_22840 [Diploscapter pachys]|uniref:Uncharacterized protein n=1 Tax=Diploscapter pachys TaxID=2018661 RepID=A0A2A2LGQ2_9BILA|nr:hypothetical protein WR25_22840 [Diploscapter pachys]